MVPKVLEAFKFGCNMAAKEKHVTNLLPGYERKSGDENHKVIFMKLIYIFYFLLNRIFERYKNWTNSFS